VVARAVRTRTPQRGERRRDVQLVAFSTTQAMNALLEGDVGTVGVVGIGYQPEVRVARKRTRPGEIALPPGRTLATAHEFVDATSGLTQAAVEEALDRLALSGATSIAV